MTVAPVPSPPNVPNLIAVQASTLPQCNKPSGSKLSSSSSTAAPLAGPAWPYPPPWNLFSMQMQPSMQPTPNIGGNVPGSSVSGPCSLHACLEFTLHPNPASYSSFLQLTYVQYITVDMLLETLYHEQPPPNTH